MVKILVVEDEEPILENILEILEINDHEVYGAQNGIEGLEMAHRHRPDLILSDINMPEMDGYNMLMSLRSDATTSHIPLIFLTAYADRDFQRRGMTLGAEDYLTKPFTPNELKVTVDTQIQKIEDRKQAVNQLRSTILSALPHELRTPLTGIVTCTDLLLMDIEEDVFDLRRAEQTLHIIQNSGKRLHRLIENHLVYTQIEAQALNPDERYRMTSSEGVNNPMGIVQLAAAQVSEMVDRSDDIIFGNSVNVRVKVNEGNLTKIVTELIDNSLKFSKEGQKVEINARVQAGMFYLVIQDAGRGMTPEQIAAIGPYMQFERDYYEQQGMGLGLVIAKKLAELHGGQVQIESVPNEGTRATLQLPIMDA